MSNFYTATNDDTVNGLIHRKIEQGSGKEEQQLPKNFIRQNPEIEDGRRRANESVFDSDPLFPSSNKLDVVSTSNVRHKKSFETTLDHLDLNSDDSNSSASQLSERVSSMLESCRYSDVVFFVGQKEEPVYAHKFVLSVGSEVFGTMLNNSHFRQVCKTNPTQEEIHIKDIEPNIFKILLKFLYTDKVQLDEDTVMAVLYAARKYAVIPLELECTNYLRTKLCAENAITILKQSLFFELYNLAEEVIKLIKTEATEILQSEHFLEIDQQTLSTILQSDDLHIKEITIFKAVIKWAQKQCEKQSLEVNDNNMRLVVGPLLYLIRFPRMTLEEFASVCQFSNLLTDKEKVDIFIHFTSSVKPEIPFSSMKRCEISGKEMSINRFQRIESRWGYTGAPDKIRFTVDVPIFITAIGVYGSIHGGSKYTASIKLINFDSKKTLGANDLTFQSDGTPEPVKLSFTEPIEVGPGSTYVIAVLLHGQDSWFGTSGLRRVCCQYALGKSSVTIQFSFSYMAGKSNGSSVDDGQIPEIYFCVKRP